jgi:hypothetical protein
MAWLDLDIIKYEYLATDSMLEFVRSSANNPHSSKEIQQIAMTAICGFTSQVEFLFSDGSGELRKEFHQCDTLTEEYLDELDNYYHVRDMLASHVTFGPTCPTPPRLYFSRKTHSPSVNSGLIER